MVGVQEEKMKKIFKTISCVVFFSAFTTGAIASTSEESEFGARRSQLSPAAQDEKDTGSAVASFTDELADRLRPENYEDEYWHSGRQRFSGILEKEAPEHREQLVAHVLGLLSTNCPRGFAETSRMLEILSAISLGERENIIRLFNEKISPAYPPPVNGLIVSNIVRKISEIPGEKREEIVSMCLMFRWNPSFVSHHLERVYELETSEEKIAGHYPPQDDFYDILNKLSTTSGEKRREIKGVYLKGTGGLSGSSIDWVLSAK